MTREQAIKLIDFNRRLCNRADELGRENGEALDMAIEALELVTSYETTIVKLTQAISEQEPKTGHWIEERDDFGKLLSYHCSNCYDDTGFMSSCAWSFCPECGAKMKRFPVRQKVRKYE